MAGVANIKNHPWFEKIEWDKLLKKELKAPFIPKIEDSIDTQNFDREFTECSIESEMSSYADEKRLSGFSFDRSPASQSSPQNDVSEFKMSI